MRSTLIAALLLVAYCEARPSFHFDARPTFGSSYIIGGENAKLGEFPWQLSQQNYYSSGWSHSCGASLLSASYALTAAHCIIGSPVETMRVVAGIIDRTSTDNGVISNVTSYKLHELYSTRDVMYSDDIAILTLASPIYANNDTIQYAKLPENSEDLFIGRTGLISGWGRTGPSTKLPQFLQKAAIGVINRNRCNQIMGAEYVDDTQICLYDESHQRSACNSDSGGPFNLDNGSEQAIVAGVTSWIIQNWRRECVPIMPSVYARTSAYLDWIKTNTP